MAKITPKTKYPTLNMTNNSQKGSTYGIMNKMKYSGQGGPGAAPIIASDLQVGSSGSDVRALQEWLIQNGFNIPDGATGYFGPQTKAALAQYQTNAGIDTKGNPGYFGPITRTAMTSGTAGGTTGGTSGGGSSAGSAGGTDSTKALVRFSADPNGMAPGDQNTIWYVDTAQKIMRPIMSDQALQDLYGNQYQAALGSIKTVDPAEVMEGGSLSDYTLLDQNYGVYEGRTATPVDFSPANIKSRYGQNVSADKNTLGAKNLDGLMSIIKQNIDTSGLSQATIDKVMNDPLSVAGYIGAMAYGGYTPMDVYMDMKRKELLSNGDNSMADVKVIDQNYTKQDYAKTQPGMAAVAKIDPLVPGRIGSLDRSVFSSTAAQMPQDFYNAAFPELNPNSPEFKAKMDQVQSVLHDSILAGISAKTDAEKQLAQTQWTNYRDEMAQFYNVRLSDDALQAWDQVNQIRSAMSQGELSGTGIEQEAIDRAIRSKREYGDIYRSRQQKEEEKGQMDYYSKSASPDEINKLNQEDQAKGLPRDQWRTVQWGITPAQPTDFNSFLQNYRTKYPDQAGVSDAEIKAKMYDPFYDQNGNGRSALYHDQAINQFITTYGYNPETGANSLGQPMTSLEQYKTQKVLDQGKAADANATAPYTSSTPFITDPNSSELQNPTPKGSIPPASGTTTTPNQALGSTTVNTNLSPTDRASLQAQLDNAKKALSGLVSKLPADQRTPQMTSTINSWNTTPAATSTQPYGPTQPPAKTLSVGNSSSTNQGSTTSGANFTAPSFNVGASGVTTPAKKTYVVKAGDTLSGIAKNVLGDATKWQSLGYSGDPTKLQVGTTLSY